MLQALKSKPLDNHFVAHSANGKSVAINLMSSAAAQSISRNPHLLSLLAEVVPHCSFDNDIVHIQCDMKRTVGYTDTVSDKAGDIIFYARQPKSDHFTRFVKNRKSVATSILSISLSLDDDRNYIITDVRIGATPPQPPGTSGSDEKSSRFWQQHAVVYSGQPLIASSVTKDCPY